MNKIQLNQANMAYLDQGSGHPIVMGHSYLWDAHMWQPQINVLSKNYRCIVPDLWSHGQSAPLAQSTYTLTSLGEDYWQFTQALQLKQFTLIGLSVGGMWATHIALNYPHAVSALVLMDTYVGREPVETQTTYLGMMDELERDGQFTPAFAKKVAPYFFARDAIQTQPTLVENFIQGLYAIPRTHITGKVALGRAIFTRPSLLEQLAQIHIPTLIIVGEEDLPRPPKEAQAMAKLIPNAQLEIIPQAGHISCLEQPGRVNEVLLKFLAQHTY